MLKEISINSSDDDWVLMLQLDDVASLAVKKMITNWTKVALLLGNAKAGVQQKKALLAVFCIYIGLAVQDDKKLWMALEKELSMPEYEYLVIKVVDIFEQKYLNQQYQLVLTCMGTNNAQTFFEDGLQYLTEILEKNGQYGALQVNSSRYLPVIPTFGKKGVLVPPELRGDPNFIVLIDTVDNVSFFFDTLQAPHFKDVSILIKGGMPHNEMRIVNKKPESRYDYTEMSEFVSDVLGDLLQAFKKYAYKVNVDGELINFNIQGEQIGNTLMEISAIRLYGHYYVTLHCYPGK